MFKNLPLLAALFVGLLLVVVYVSRAPESVDLEKLRIPGWKTVGVTRAEDAGFKKIELVKGSMRVVMSREEGEEGRWKILEPVQGEAETYRVRAVLNLFESELRPTVTSRIPDGKAARYGLSGDDLIKLKIFKEGDKPFVDILIGRSDSSEAPPGEIPVKRTWLASPDLRAAHLVEGKRFRSALDLSLKELRSRKILSIKKWSDIDRAEVVLGEGEKKQEVVIVREAQKTAEEERLEKWRFEVPEGLPLGEPRAWFSSLKGLTATEIIPFDGKAKDYGFEKKSELSRVLIKVGDASLAMTVGAEVEGESWLRIDGKEHEIYKISPYTRKQLLKTAQDLRDKRILGIKDKSDVRAIQLRRKGETPLVLERNAERWSRASDGALADSDAINLFLNALVNFRASEFGDFAELAPTLKTANFALRLMLANPEREEEFLFGSDEDGKILVQQLGGEAFKVSAFAGKQLGKSWDALENKRVFSMDPAQVRVLSLVRKDEAGYRLVLEPEGADEGGEGARRSVWKLESHSELRVKTEKVSAMIATLDSLKAKKVLTASRSSARGLGKGEGTQITVMLSNGDELSLQISDERDDDTHFARARGGLLNSIFTISSAQAEKLVRTKEELLK